MTKSAPSRARRWSVVAEKVAPDSQRLVESAGQGLHLLQRDRVDVLQDVVGTVQGRRCQQVGQQLGRPLVAAAPDDGDLHLDQSPWPDLRWWRPTADTLPSRPAGGLRSEVPSVTPEAPASGPGPGSGPPRSGRGPNRRTGSARCSRRRTDSPRLPEEVPATHRKAELACSNPRLETPGPVSKDWPGTVNGYPAVQWSQPSARSGFPANVNSHGWSRLSDVAMRRHRPDAPHELPVLHRSAVDGDVRASDHRPRSLQAPRGRPGQLEHVRLGGRRVLEPQEELTAGRDQGSRRSSGLRARKRGPGPAGGAATSAADRWRCGRTGGPASPPTTRRRGRTGR